MYNEIFMITFIKRRWYIVLILVIIIGIIVYQNQNTATKSSKDTTYTIKRQTLEEDLSLSGKIDADEKATLHFQSAGRIVWSGVKVGDYIEQYQGIATLDARDIQLRLKKYLNTYEKTRRDFDQSKSDTREVKIGTLTKDQRDQALRAFEKAQFDLNNSVLDVEIQSIAAESSYLYSPINGILVEATSLYPGMNVSPATDTYVVVNPQTVYFSATADQTDIPQLSNLNQGEITLDAYPDEKVIGTIDQISFVPKQDESGTVYSVKMILSDANRGPDIYKMPQTNPGEDVQYIRSNSDYRFRIGMTGDVSFVLRKKEHALAAPSRFIKTEQNRKYVNKLKNGKIVKTYVKTGDTYDTDIEIISGVEAGDVISE